MISTMGTPTGEAKGEFLLIDSKSLEVKGTWTKGKTATFGYDFWYQPYHDVLVSSEWGVPKIFKTGFHKSDPLDPGKFNFLFLSKKICI